MYDTIADIYIKTQFFIAMLQARTKRIKTDYSKSSNKHQMFNVKLRQNKYSMPKRVSTLESRQNQITRILQFIHHQTNYELLNQEAIRQERNNLTMKIQEVREALHKMLQISLQKRNQEDKAFQKITIAQEMGLNYHNLCKESLNNKQIIDSLKAEYADINQKLVWLCNPDIKLNQAILIEQTDSMTKKMKRQIEKMRKNKFLRQREIVRGKINQSSELQQLQREYIALTKKEQNLLQRVQIIQKDIIDSDISLLKQKQYCTEIKGEVTKIPEAKSENMKQHLQIIYKSHKKQLQLNLKKHERQEESLKKKYYQLLVDYQNYGIREEEIDNKIFIVSKQNQYALNNIEQRLKKYARKKGGDNHKDFMLTEPEQSKQQYRTEIKEQQLDIGEERESAQRRLNAINANACNVVRKWNIKKGRGSIIKQSLSSSISRQNQSKNLQESNYSSSKPDHSKSNSSSKQIKHFRTESAPVIDEQYLSDRQITFIEEEYQEDFES